MPKILVIRFSSIGDIVLTSPVVRALKQQLQDAEVHFLTKKIFAPQVVHNPFIDKNIFLEESLSGVLQELKKERYAYIVDLHRNLRTLRVKMQLGKKSFSYNKLNLEKWLMVNLRINRLPDTHIVDRYFDAVAPLGVLNDGQGLDYFISPDEEVNLNALPPSHRGGYVAFVIGARHATKCLPEEKIIAILKKVTTPVVLIGGKEDTEKGTRIASASGAHVFSVCGQYSINQSASLVKQARKVVTHDTGLMHIAAAFRKEIISVWGNTIPAFGMSPYLPDASSVIIETKDLSCRPCSKIGYDKCPRKHFNCMNRLNEDVISAKIK